MPVPMHTVYRFMLRHGSISFIYFGHEHFLVIRADGMSILMSGCAHNGILSIMDEYVKRFGKAPKRRFFHAFRGEID